MNLTPNVKRNLAIGGLAILALLIVGSAIGAIVSFIVLVIKGIVGAVAGLIGFAFHSVFNLLLVGGLGYLAYRWYRSRQPVVKDSNEGSERRPQW